MSSLNWVLKEGLSQQRLEAADGLLEYNMQPEVTFRPPLLGPDSLNLPPSWLINYGQ